MLESVRKLVAEYSEFQRRRPDLPQGNLWGFPKTNWKRLSPPSNSKGILMLTST
jgi:hypothetical protein